MSTRHIAVICPQCEQHVLIHLIVRTVRRLQSSIETELVTRPVEHICPEADR